MALPASASRETESLDKLILAVLVRVVVVKCAILALFAVAIGLVLLLGQATRCSKRRQGTNIECKDVDGFVKGVTERPKLSRRPPSKRFKKD